MEEEDFPKIQILELHLHLVQGRPVKETTVVQHITIQLVEAVEVQELLAVMPQIN